MDEFDPKSNSNLSREHSAAQPQKPKKVVTGAAKPQKKSPLQRAIHAMFPGNMGSVADYILTDVLIPKGKDIVREIFYSSIDILLGEPSKKTRRSGLSGSYRDYYDDDRRERRRPRTAGAYDYDDIVFDARADAEEVLYRMEEMIREFGLVSVGDMYDMAGLTCEFTANKYGWKDLYNARIERAGSGWRIRLPMPTLL